MTTTVLTADPRYPIGKFTLAGTVSDAQRSAWIDDIADAPARLRTAVQGLGADQLDTPYREGGWTPRQVVHHMADSHMNAFVRFKHALTETDPAIKPYDEAAWALLPDVAATPVEVSLTLLDALHNRWVQLLRKLTPTECARAYFHPDKNRLVPLDEAIGMYAWHGRHHVAHITTLRERQGW